MKETSLISNEPILENYWANSGDPDLLFYFIKKIQKEDEKERLKEFFATGLIRFKPDDSVVFKDSEYGNADTFFSLLFHAGYLTYANNLEN
jgi:hypothetical protein